MNPLPSNMQHSLIVYARALFAKRFCHALVGRLLHAAKETLNRLGIIAGCYGWSFRWKYIHGHQSSSFISYTNGAKRYVSYFLGQNFRNAMR